METRLVVFKDKQIRRTLHNNECWFVLEDVVLALIDSKYPKQGCSPQRRADSRRGTGEAGG